MALDADHASMCRFASRQDKSYVACLKNIERILKKHTLAAKKACRYYRLGPDHCTKFWPQLPVQDTTNTTWFPTRLHRPILVRKTFQNVLQKIFCPQKPHTMPAGFLSCMELEVSEKHRCASSLPRTTVTSKSAHSFMVTSKPAS